jgi:hypothetical protein
VPSHGFGVPTAARARFAMRQGRRLGVVRHGLESVEALEVGGVRAVASAVAPKAVHGWNGVVGWKLQNEECKQVFWIRYEKVYD